MNNIKIGLKVGINMWPEFEWLETVQWRKTVNTVLDLRIL